MESFAFLLFVEFGSYVPPKMQHCKKKKEQLHFLEN